MSSSLESAVPARATVTAARPMSPPFLWFGIGIATKSFARVETSASSLARSPARRIARATFSTSSAAALRFSYSLSDRPRRAAWTGEGKGRGVRC